MIARPTLNRRPVITRGSAPGTVTLKKICLRLPPKARTASTNRPSTVVIPVYVLNKTGKTAPMKTIAIFEAIPTPSAVMKSGANRMIGALYEIVTQGMRMSLAVRLSAISTPSPIPIATPTR